jgi:purine-nucleoside phosphorylase
MHPDDPIVLPVRNPKTPLLGKRAILVASEDDLRNLQQRLSLPKQRKLYMSTLYFDTNNLQIPALVGPVMGAPYATMIMEILHAWGVDTILFWGWCGSIHPERTIGDIIIPIGAYIDEGTSLHYDKLTGEAVDGDRYFVDQIAGEMIRSGIQFHKDKIWTTDAVFRETRTKLNHFMNRGARAVEMELSALLSVAIFHSIRAAGILAVSDELYAYQWKPGFKDERFIRCRKVITDLLSEDIQHLSIWKLND